MEEKNIGVVEYFNADSDNENCGFIKIKFTSQFEYLKSAGSKSFRVYISRSEVEANKFFLEKGNVVCFDLIENEKSQYHHAENIRQAEVEDLLTFIFNEKNYNTVKSMVTREKGEMGKKFFDALFSEKYSLKYKWVRDDFFICVKKFAPVQKWDFLESRIEKFSDAEVLPLFEDFIANDSKTLSNLLTLSTPVNVKRLSLPKAIVAKLSYCVENSTHKVECAEFLLNNLELFKAVDVADEFLIFMMYVATKENKISREFLTSLNSGKKIFERAPRIKIIYHYLCAGFYKANGEIGKMKSEINKADQIFVDIFTINFDNPENFPELRHVLPSCDCPDIYYYSLEGILYCESKKWNAPKKDNFGKNLQDENGELIRETVIYCPRLSNKPENPPKYARLYANFNLPINKWSIIELVKKLELDTYNEHFQDGEFFNYLGASFNRLWELREKLKCRVCGEYMKPAKPVKFRKVTKIGDLTNKYKPYHATFGVTVFQCKDKNCSEYDKGVYLNYCWHCHEIVDSRDTPVKLFNPNAISNHKTYNAAEHKFVETFDGKPAPFYSDKDNFGYYSCINCGAGYKDSDKSILDEASEIKYEVFTGTLCPKCTKCPKCCCQELSIIKADGGFKLKCNSCGEEFFAKMMIPDSKNKRKFTCADENCKHAVYLNRDMAEVIKSDLKLGYSPIPWAKEILPPKNPEPEPFFESSEEWIALGCPE